MKNKNIFDVIVVYTDGIAKSAANTKYKGHTPFLSSSRRANYNETYAYFMESCQNYGLRAAFSTSADIVGKGTCSSYWTYEDDNWNRHIEPCFSKQIFDKFSPINKKKKNQKKLLFSSKQIRPFNDSALSEIFFDKHKTFATLTDYTIPTVTINSKSILGVKRAINKLRKLVETHPHSEDFCNTIIVKDRFGAGGNNIYKVDTDFALEICKILNKKTKVSFVIQPFVFFGKGYSYKKRTAATDIRLIYQNDKVVQAYLRMAKPSDFRCNEHQGGTLIYVDQKDIPTRVLDCSAEIAQNICTDSSLFALDFIVSDNGNVYMLEGNIGPGLDWNKKQKKNERMSKYLIDTIVEEISLRTNLITPENNIDEVTEYIDLVQNKLAVL